MNETQVSEQGRDYSERQPGPVGGETIPSAVPLQGMRIVGLGFVCIAVAACSAGSEDSRALSSSGTDTAADDETETTTGPDGSGGEETGSGPAPDGPFGSGSRLKAVVLDGGPGAQSLVGWFDTELEVECAFEPVEDRVACLSIHPLRSGFVDPACTDEVHVVFFGDAPPSRLRDGPAELAADGTVAYPTATIGPAMPAPSIVYVDDGQGCSPQSGAEAVYSVLGRESVQGVAASVRVDPGDGSLGSQIAEADDGSFFSIGLFDIQRQVPCSLTSNLDGVCVPSEESRRLSVNEFAYGDAACSPPGLGQYFDGAPRQTPLVAWQHLRTEPLVPQDNAYYAVGDPVDTVYGHDSGTCAPSNPVSDSTFFHLGAALGPNELPSLSFEQRGEGRLRKQLVVDGNGKPLVDDIDLIFPHHSLDGPIVSPTLWWDTDLQTQCEPVMAGDCTLRCIPALEPIRFGENEFWADDQCEAIPVATWIDPALPPGTWFQGLGSEDPPQCGGTQAALPRYRAIEAIEGPIFARTPDGCVPLPMQAALGRYSLERVEDERFAPFARLVE